MSNRVKVDNPKPPIQLFSKLEATGEFVPTEAWACGECKMLNLRSPDYDYAANCCKQHYCKNECGEKLKDADSPQLCWTCRSIKREETLIEVPYKGGPVTTLDGDGERFFSDMDELVDYYCDNEAEVPEFVHECDVEGYPGLDIHHAIEQSVEELYEDAEDALVDVEELEDFIRMWNAKQTLKTWMPRYKEKVRVPTPKAIAAHITNTIAELQKFDTKGKEC